MTLCTCAPELALEVLAATTSHSPARALPVFCSWGQSLHLDPENFLPFLPHPRAIPSSRSAPSKAPCSTRCPSAGSRAAEPRGRRPQGPKAHLSGMLILPRTVQGRAWYQLGMAFLTL